MTNVRVGIACLTLSILSSCGHAPLPASASAPAPAPEERTIAFVDVNVVPLDTERGYHISVNGLPAEPRADPAGRLGSGAFCAGQGGDRAAGGGHGAERHAAQTLSLRHTDLIAPMVKAIQEQQQMIDALHKELHEVKATLANRR